jgi:hypothetical protein
MKPFSGHVVANEHVLRCSFGIQHIWEVLQLSGYHKMHPRRRYYCMTGNAFDANDHEEAHK